MARLGKVHVRDWSRRAWIHRTGAGLLGSTVLSSAAEPWTLDPPTLDHTQPSPVSLGFPAQDPARVQETVGASHRDLARVKELVTRQPALAKAAWDWGFGDWETALGAASHVGNKDIARFLLDQGAPPTIFSAAMLGQLEVVRALITASPGIQRKRGPHGITLLSHAVAGGPEAAEVVAYLKSVGGADERIATVTLAAAERTQIAGSYRFGAGETDLFVIQDVREMLQIARAGRNSIRMACLTRDQSSWTFYPAGAEAVRIKLEKAGDRVSSLTIADPEVVLTASRVD